MFGRFTHSARRVVYFGRLEATECQSVSIRADHLLLGLLREHDAIAKRMLERGMAAADVRETIKQRQRGRKTTPVSVDMPLGDDAKRALDFAVEEADAASHRHVGSGHLLVGLLRVDDSFARELMNERGLDLATLRAEFASVEPGQAEGTD